VSLTHRQAKEYRTSKSKTIATKGDSQMPNYIALLKWTQQGIENVKDSPGRLDAGRKAFKKSGVKIKDTYLTMGRYDLVCIIDAPDDETAARAMLTLGSQGNVQSETLKAFTEAEYRKIVGSL
jgi:uncharacterized protein with GYD domain